MNRIVLSRFDFNFQAGLPVDVDRLEPGFIETTNEGPPDRQAPRFFLGKLVEGRLCLDFFDFLTGPAVEAPDSGDGRLHGSSRRALRNAAPRPACSA